MSTETPKRLKPTPNTLRRLYLKSGNQCAYPGCTDVMIDDEDVVAGLVCHIEAAMPGGERFNADQTNEERRSFSNLMMMCHKHHVKTNDVDQFPVERLKKIKAEHEAKTADRGMLLHDAFENRTNDVTETILAQSERIIEHISDVSDGDALPLAFYTHNPSSNNFFVGVSCIAGKRRLRDVEANHCFVSSTGGTGFGETIEVGVLHPFNGGKSIPNTKSLPNLLESQLSDSSTAHLRIQAANGCFWQMTRFESQRLGTNPVSLLTADVKVFQDDLSGELLYHETRRYHHDGATIEYWRTPKGWLPPGASRPTSHNASDVP